MRRHSALLISAVAAACCFVPMAWGAECLPPGFEQTIPEAPAPSRIGSAPGAAAVYLDSSLSMLGFVQTHRDPQYADIVLRLPEALEQVSAATTFNRFGKSIMPLPVEKLTEALRPGSYVCQPASKDAARQLGCDTRIDQVLQVIAASDDRTVSLMITDLFLSREDIIGSEAGTMKQSLARVLRAGKSIAILGVSAAFDGVIYDLPPTQNGATGEARNPKKKYTTGANAPITSYDHKGGERPFFIVMAGKDDQLLALQNFFETNLLQGLPKNHSYFTLFTRSPARPAAATTPLKLAPGQGVREEGSLPDGPDWLPLIGIDKGQAPIIARQPLRELQMGWPFTPPLARFKARSVLWLDAGGRCKVRWQDVGRSADAIVTAQADGSDLVLGFEREGLTALVPTRTYLMRLQVQATGTGEAKLMTGWLHDWSFNEKQTGALLASKPEFFPALNLGEFADSLEAIVRSSFEPATVVDAVVAFRKGR